MPFLRNSTHLFLSEFLTPPITLTLPFLRSPRICFLLPFLHQFFLLVTLKLNPLSSQNHLNPEQIEKLQKALKEEEKANIREIILILLLLNDGKTQSKIADFLGCSVNKVSYWCVKGDPDNLESLRDERMKGNHKKATDKYIEILLKIIEKDPQELGYDFGRWTAQRLATYLE